MTILLHDYIQLDERESQHLRIWKIWHVILYVLAAVFGVLNYVFLQNTLALVDGNCLLYPRNLVFHMAEKPHVQDYVHTTIEANNITSGIYHNDTNDAILPRGIEAKDIVDGTNYNDTNKSEQINNSSFKEPISDSLRSKNEKEEVQRRRKRADDVPNKIEKKDKKTSKNVEQNVSEAETSNVDSTPEDVTPLKNTTNNEIVIVVNNVTIVIENATHHLALDTSHTYFGKEGYCEYAEYMPIICTIFSIVWTTFFIMCPGGGRTRTGLQQPWRILMPSLIFAVVMVGLTGHSFSLTNGGLQDFCSAFHNLTNATGCSAVDRFVEKSWNSSWGVGVGVGITRACSAGAWALWACAATVLLARLLTARDFVVKRTGVYLAKDPLQKITPHLQKTPRSGKRSVPSSPRLRDTSSMKSEPTVTTELVTASVERAQDSTPTSVTTTPLKHDQREDLVELTHSPAELFNGYR